MPTAAVIAIHHQQILEHGGLQGVRQPAALDAALGRPQQRWIYGELTTIPDLAAAYAEALIKAHPFSDGNKRTGFLIAVVFLGLNRFSFHATNESVVVTVQQLAANALPWHELQQWFQVHSRNLP